MNTKGSSWRGRDLETRVVPDGFLHPGAAFSRFEGERANLDVREKPCVEMRLKSHRNGKIKTTCVSKRSAGTLMSSSQLVPGGAGFPRDSPGIPPGSPVPGDFWGISFIPLGLGAGMSSGREREGEGRQQ